mgnify:CR=1 FL=1
MSKPKTTYAEPKTPEHIEPAPTSTGKLPPSVDFKINERHDILAAGPPGATIRCRWQDGKSTIYIHRTDDGDHIASVAIADTGPHTITDETIAIASALYWSWWRSEDMRGVTCAEPIATEAATAAAGAE